MMRLVLTIFLIIFLSMQTVFAQDMFKITSVNFDTSNSIILLTSSSSKVSEEIKSIKINSLEDPKRFYFDVDSSVLTTGAQNWFFNSQDLKQVKISQFNPSTVRVVLYTSENFKKENISVIKQNKTLIVQLKNDICDNDYFELAYTDEKTSSGKYYENLSISNTEINKIKTAQNAINNDTLSKVQDAFSKNTPETESIVKDLKLKTNYYISSLNVKNDSVLLSGFGHAIMEKPMYLTNPTRVVFDLPNSITNYDIRNKTYTSGGTMMKVAQFDASRSRLVITPPTENVDYIPVFSPDGQSILFVKAGTEGSKKLFTQKNNATGYYINNKNELIISFDTPVVHSVKREGEELKVTFYNTYSFNENYFNKTITKTLFQNANINVLDKIGLSLTLPITKNAVVKTYMGADGKAIKIVLNNMQLTTPSQKTTIIPKKEQKDKIKKLKGKHIVVIDAGHGGSDYGAIREGINEKDINLDVARMVNDILAQAGVTTIMTRDSDEFISLADRVDISTRNEAELFVSIHVNASVKPEINGLETHYYNDNSLDFANIVHSNLINTVNKKDRGVFKSKFYVINHNTMPAILVEIGFISNSLERSDLTTQERKQKTAQAIAEGILQYLNAK